MSYVDTTDLSFADGYYHIGFKGFGVVELDENTPLDIQKRFWEVWPFFHKMVVERQNNGLFSSKYPILPEEDPEENKKHYL